MGRRFDEDDEAEAVARLVLGVQPRELGEHLRFRVGALLRRGPRREAGALADGGVRGQDLDLFGVGQLVHERGGARERVRLQRQALDEARAALEQAGQLAGAQLPR